jgi:hypothetical protein
MHVCYVHMYVCMYRCGGAGGWSASCWTTTGCPSCPSASSGRSSSWCGPVRAKYEIYTRIYKGYVRVIYEKYTRYSSEQSASSGRSSSWCGSARFSLSYISHNACISLISRVYLLQRVYASYNAYIFLLVRPRMCEDHRARNVCYKSSKRVKGMKDIYASTRARLIRRRYA